jgi:hypothetical protein
MIEPRRARPLIGWIERSALLSVPEERVKIALDQLATELVAGISGTIERSRTSTLAPDFLRFFNQGALAQYQYGNFAVAHQLCEAAIQFCFEQHDDTKDAAWLAEILQPCVNLGRLYAIDGQTHEALRQFRAVFSFLLGDEDLVVGDRVVACRTGEAWEAGHRNNLLNIFRNAYVADSVRACLINEDYVRLEQFLEECRSESLANTFADRYRIEGEVRYHLRVGELRRSLEFAVELWNICKRDATPDPTVLALFHDIYSAAGETPSAQSIRQRMTSYCDQLMNANPPKHRILKRVLYSLALRHLACGDVETAEALAGRCYSLAISLGDECVAIRSAWIICSSGKRTPGPSVNSDESRGASLFKMANRTFYRLDQVIAYLELQAEGYRPDGSDLPMNASYTEMLSVLIKKIGVTDAKKIRETFPDVFESESSKTNWEYPINVCPQMQTVHDLLMDVAKNAIRS